jgi:hypothetical protein
VDLPRDGSSSPDQLNPLSSLASDLLLCTSIAEMIPLIFRMYTLESRLYKNMNTFLRCFPLRLVSKFMKEFRGLLRYLYLLQSSIE